MAFAMGEFRNAQEEIEEKALLWSSSPTVRPSKHVVFWKRLPGSVTAVDNGCQRWSKAKLLVSSDTLSCALPYSLLANSSALVKYRGQRRLNVHVADIRTSILALMLKYSDLVGADYHLSTTTVIADTNYSQNPKL